MLIGEDGAPFLDRSKNKAYIINGKTWVNNHAHVLQGIENISINSYILYYLNSIEYKPYVNGTTRLKLTKGSLSNIPIPLPSIHIQQAIVSKIEELFSELDKGIEQLKIAQQQLKTYRQAVLKWAFEGKLTNDASIQEGLPPGWQWIKSGDLFEFVTSGSRGWAKYYSQSGSIFLRITNLDFDSLDLDLDENKIQYVELPVNTEGVRTKVKEGDFLFSITGYLGMFAIASKLENAYVNQHIALCRPKPGFNKKFVGYWIISKSGGHRHLNAMTKGATKAGLSLDNIKNFPIPLPSLDEQNQVVLEIETRLSIVSKNEGLIDQAIQQSVSLRQSILKMAFEGRLTETSTLGSVEASVKEIPEERKVLAARIIHMFEKDKNFGLTKFQKVFYLAENHAQVPYDTHYIKETAGPYDRDFTRAFRQEMQQEDWVQEEQRGNKTRLLPGDNIGKLEKEYAKYFRSKSKQIVFVIEQLMAKSTHEAELIATLYAVWNNRLIQKKTVKVDHLVADFFSWSPKKIAEFQKEEIISTYKWMKGIDFVPTGFGKVIESVKD